MWYTAASLRGAVAEAFGRQGFLDRAAGFRVIQAVVRDATPVLDLVGLAPRALRLTQEIAATTDYLACQHWARAFYDRYPEIRGLRWRGRQSGSLCVMLHDRADMNRLDGESWAMTDPAVWPRIARAARDCRLRVV